MIIAYQGVQGAYSHAAAQGVRPDCEAVAYPTFEETFEAVEQGTAEFAIVPQENSIAGRVAEIHPLLCSTPLKIIGEYFQPIHHCLLGIKGANLAQAKFVHSHFQGLAQSRRNLQRLALTPVVEANTALAAQKVQALNNAEHVAIASRKAAEIYHLDVLQDDLADQPNNVTRFIILAREALPVQTENKDLITSFVFRVRNIPAALFKALGGFATNKINMIKLESHMTDGSFLATQFYCEIEGHPEHDSIKLAFDELGYFTDELKILGIYPANVFRQKR